MKTLSVVTICFLFCLNSIAAIEGSSGAHYKCSLKSPTDASIDTEVVLANTLWKAFDYASSENEKSTFKLSLTRLEASRIEKGHSKKIASGIMHANVTLKNEGSEDEKNILSLQFNDSGIVDLSVSAGIKKILLLQCSSQHAH